jgi:hypothetical protein
MGVTWPGDKRKEWPAKRKDQKLCRPPNQCVNIGEMAKKASTGRDVCPYSTFLISIGFPCNGQHVFEVIKKGEKKTHFLTSKSMFLSNHQYHRKNGPKNK